MEKQFIESNKNIFQNHHLVDVRGYTVSFVAGLPTPNSDAEVYNIHFKDTIVSQNMYVLGDNEHRGCKGVIIPFPQFKEIKKSIRCLLESVNLENSVITSSLKGYCDLEFRDDCYVGDIVLDDSQGNRITAPCKATILQKDDSE